MTRGSVGRRIGALLALVLFFPGLAEAAAQVAVLDAGGGSQRALYLSPPKPRGTLVMLPGGAGDIGIGRDGQLRHGDNFVVRTRDLWLARGYAVVIPDAPDHESLRGRRSLPGYAAVVRDLVGIARSQAPGPVFLLGTSQGSIAAVNGAAHMPSGWIAGVVLTESVSRLGGSGETVFSASPEDVRVPVLVVANRDDRCAVAPPGDVPGIARALSAAPEVRVLSVSGGTDRSGDACGSLSPHGYDGIEPLVVGDIADWLDAHR